ncbi:MAG: hypothetical protein Kow0059_13660 [Candidatus Sumerlaeia bacterium]
MFAVALMLAPALGPGAAVVKWRISVGFGGFFRPGQWTPVSAIIDYTSPLAGGEGSGSGARDVRGTLEAYSVSTNNVTHLHQRPVEIPVNSRLRFVFYIRLTDADTAVEVVLRDERGRRVLSETFSGLSALKPTDSLTIVPSRSAVALHLPNALEFTVNQKSLTKIAVVDPLTLPDHWFGYGGVNLLLISGYEDNMLTAQQVAAIEDWVRSGGELWALGGRSTQSYSNQLLEPLLPAEMKKTWTKPWSEAGAAPVVLVLSALEPRPGARVLAADPMPASDEPSRPLVVGRTLGSGRICVWAVDFASPLFTVSPFFQSCWWSLYPFEIVNRLESYFGYRLLLQIEQKMGLRKAVRIPSLLLIFLFISAFAVMVGPVNFWLLARRRKMEWGWVTTPVIIAAFTLLIYGYALVFKGSSYLERDFELWATAPGSRAVHRQALSFIFSSRRQDVSLQPLNAQGFVAAYAMWDEYRNQLIWGHASMFAGVLRSGPTTGGGLTPASAPHVHQTGERSLRVARSTIHQWAPAGYLGEAVEDVQTPLVECDLSLVPAGVNNWALSGTVRNTSPFDWSHAIVRLGDTVFKLDGVGKGRQVSLDAVRAVAMDGFLGSEQARLRSLDIYNPAHYGEFVWFEMIEKLMKWGEFRSFVNPSRGGVCLIALIENPGLFPSLVLTPPPRTSSRHVVLISPITLHPPSPGPMPPLSGEMVRQSLLFLPDTYLSELVSRNDALGLSQASMTLMSDVPLDSTWVRPARIRLTFALWPSGTGAFVLSAFNFQTGQWDRLEDRLSQDVGRWSVDLPSNSYVSPINTRAFFRLDSILRGTSASFGDGNYIRDIQAAYFY